MQNNYLSVIFLLLGQTGHPNAVYGIFGRKRINIEQCSLRLMCGKVYTGRLSRLGDGDCRRTG